MRDCERRISLDAPSCDVVTRLMAERDGALAEAALLLTGMEQWQDNCVIAQSEAARYREALELFVGACGQECSPAGHCGMCGIALKALAEPTPAEAALARVRALPPPAHGMLAALPDTEF